MSEEQRLERFFKGLETDAPVAEIRRLYDMLTLEDSLWKQGFDRIAGVDEAGRGPLAGPVIAAAVVLDHPIVRLNDSKRLSDSQRRVLFEHIMGEHHFGIGAVSAAEIDATGIQPANYKAMRCAILALETPPDFVLVDGYALSGISQPTMRVIKGDSRSLSIAAASVIAKVTRDNVMLDLDARYPEYGFAAHKGYGTQAHLEAIEKFGPCPEHRLSFAPLRREEKTETML